MIVALVVISGLAWACTPQARIIMTPDRGVAGSTVFLKGEAFDPNGRVEIYWASQKGEQQLLVQLFRVGEFTYPVKVPQVAPGVYYIKAVGIEGSGQSNLKEAPGVFQVLAPSAASQAAEPSPVAAQQPPQTAQLASEPQQAAAASAAPAAEARQTTVTRKPASKEAVTVAPVVGAEFAAPVGGGQADETLASTPSRRSAGGDVWSGLGPGASAMMGPGVEAPAARHDATSRTAGVVLLATGLVALLASFAVARVRGRRALDRGQAV
ncbi:MAG: hypothetical protein ACRDJ4_00795 [Actinomycetota bacterium]